MHQERFDFEIAGVTVNAKAAKNASKANLAIHSKTERNGMDEASCSKIYEQATARMKSGFFKPLPPTMTDPKQLSQYQTLIQLLLIWENISKPTTWTTSRT
jgi:hypothetical protein